MSDPSGSVNQQSPAEQEPGQPAKNIKRASAAALIDAFVDEYRTDREAYNRREKHRVWREWLTIGGLFVAALFAFLQWKELGRTDKNIERQANLIGEQLPVMRTQADAANKSATAALQQSEIAVRQAVAAERASTAGRAYLFVKYEMLDNQVPQIGPPVPLAQQTLSPATFDIPIRFSIKNFGQTPAIITKVKTHLLISAGAPILDPPDPSSPEGIPLRESRRLPVRAGGPTTEGRDWTIFTDENPIMPTRIVFPGGAESGVLEQVFIFNNRVRPPGYSAHGAWFYCEVTYKDIFGEKDRHTFFYVGLMGAGIRFHQDPKYNRWD